MITAQVSLLIGIMLLVSFFFFRLILLFRISFLLLALAAPLSAILSRATTFGLQNSKERLSSIALICVLNIPLLTGMIYVIAFTLPYLYTPPAINGENYKFYSRCVAFVRSQNKHEDIIVTCWGHYAKDGSYFPRIDPNGTEMKNNFSEDEISEMLLLSKQMKKFGCLRFIKDNDIILFYSRRNSIIPTRPGVAFSISGINPNDVDSETVNSYKPFLRIEDRWYMSKHLVYGGLRGDKRMSLPKSLIDHSLGAKAR